MKKIKITKLSKIQQTVAAVFCVKKSGCPACKDRFSITTFPKITVCRNEALRRNIRIETPRLFLREFVPEDAGALIAVASQPHIGRWLPDWIGSEKWASPWIEMVQRHYATDNPEQEFLAFAIVRKDTGELIGHISIGGSKKGIGIGYFMSGPFTRKGYTTEAAKALTDYAFQKYQYDHLVATVQPGNIASNRVVQKLGFTRISTIRMLDNGQTEELPFHLYRLNNPYAGRTE